MSPHRRERNLIFWFLVLRCWLGKFKSSDRVYKGFDKKYLYEHGISVIMISQLLDALFGVGKSKPDNSTSQLMEEKQNHDFTRFHDYTDQYWGHSIGFSGFQGIDSNGIAYQKEFPVTGFGYGINRGDKICIEMSSGFIGVIELKNISYCRDPHDLWNATGKWVGYITGNKGPVRKIEFQTYGIGL